MHTRKSTHADARTQYVCPHLRTQALAHVARTHARTQRATAPCYSRTDALMSTEDLSATVRNQNARAHAALMKYTAHAHTMRAGIHATRMHSRTHADNTRSFPPLPRPPPPLLPLSSKGGVRRGQGWEGGCALEGRRHECPTQNCHVALKHS